jgi:hypothetical protein
MVAPTNLLPLEALDFVSGRDGGMKVFAGGRQLSARCELRWRQRRGLRACGQRRRASGYTESEFEKVAAFHNISPALVAVGC